MKYTGIDAKQVHLHVQNLRNKIYNDIYECIDNDEPMPDESDVDKCIYIASLQIPFLMKMPDSLWAIFVEDDGTVTFTMQLVQADVRTSYRIKDGTIEVVVT